MDNRISAAENLRMYLEDRFQTGFGIGRVQIEGKDHYQVYRTSGAFADKSLYAGSLAVLAAKVEAEMMCGDQFNIFPG